MVQTANVPRSQYSPCALNSRRNRGAIARTSRTEMTSSALVNLERNPRPMSKPVAGQERKNLGVRSSASQNVIIAAVQKKIDNGSIVIRNAPTLKIGVTLSATTSHKPAVALNKRRAK